MTRPTPLQCFLIAAGVPFLVTLGWFTYVRGIERAPGPREYIELAKRDEMLEWTIPSLDWKYFLAKDAVCAKARIVVFGSSRAREIDRHVLDERKPICNLHVAGLHAPTFALLVGALPASLATERRTAYVALDHFFFWWKPVRSEWPELAEISEPAWRFWQLYRRLRKPFLEFSLPLVVRSAWRDQPDGDSAEPALWFAEGHGFQIKHYEQKASGNRRAIGEQALRTAFIAHFTVDGRWGEVGQPYVDRINAAYVRSFDASLRQLRAKGYDVWLFWNPLHPGYLKIARSTKPKLFQDTLDAVSRIAESGVVARYAGGDGKLDASRLGCSDRDFMDAVHIDVDCFRRFWAETFGVRPSYPDDTLSRMLLSELRRKVR